MYEARVIHRFLCKLTRQIYDPGDTYRAETWERLVELASLNPPRVELPDEEHENASAPEAAEAEQAVKPRKRSRR